VVGNASLHFLIRFGCRRLMLGILAGFTPWKSETSISPSAPAPEFANICFCRSSQASCAVTPCPSSYPSRWWINRTSAVWSWSMNCPLSLKDYPLMNGFKEFACCSRNIFVITCVTMETYVTRQENFSANGTGWR
jgi:hypothetical protein